MCPGGYCLPAANGCWCGLRLSHPVQTFKLFSTSWLYIYFHSFFSLSIQQSLKINYIWTKDFIIYLFICCSTCKRNRFLISTGHPHKNLILRQYQTTKTKTKWTKRNLQNLISHQSLQAPPPPIFETFSFWYCSSHFRLSIMKISPLNLQMLTFSPSCLSRGLL